MPRYIDAEKLRYLHPWVEEDKGIVQRTVVYKEDVDKVPTADVVEVKHGHWIPRKYGWSCSNCNAFLAQDDEDDTFNQKYRRNCYCYSCGTKMDEEMPRYIDADDLLTELAFYTDRPTKSVMKLIKSIARHPADVIEVKPGEWKHLGGDEWCCSRCGFVITTGGSREHPRDIGNDFCKHCGADMRGEKEDA